MNFWLTCKTGCECDALWSGYCWFCWYTVCGGDQALDADLALPPTVWISGTATA